jgi:hypothetical protein
MQTNVASSSQYKINSGATRLGYTAVFALSVDETAVVEASQTTFAGFFVGVAQIQAGIVHGLHHNVEAA